MSYCFPTPYIPKSNRFVIRPGHNSASVRAHRYACHPVRVTDERLSHCFVIPQSLNSNCLVIWPGYYLTSVRAHCHTPHPVRVTGERLSHRSVTLQGIYMNGTLIRYRYIAIVVRAYSDTLHQTRLRGKDCPITSLLSASQNRIVLSPPTQILSDVRSRLLLHMLPSPCDGKRLSHCFVIRNFQFELLGHVTTIRFGFRQRSWLCTTLAACGW